MSTFPKRIAIQLAEPHRHGLAEIARRLPHRDDQDLLALVISRGIVEILSSRNEAVSPEEVAKNQAAAKARMRDLRLSETSGLLREAKRPYPAPGVRYREKQRERLESIQETGNQHERELHELMKDVGVAESHVDGMGDDEGHPSSSDVERYVATVLPEDVRTRMETFLQAHPEFDQEEALSILVRRGLDHSEELQEVVESAREKQAAKMLRLAERLYARSKRRCG